MKCPICGTQTECLETYCLRCQKEITNAEEENYHKTLQADMEVDF